MASNQTIQYVVDADVRGVIRNLNEADRAALQFEKSLKDIAAIAGIGGLAFGLRELVSAGNDWVKTAADIETSMLRIKNASEAGFGIKNQFFIKDEIAKFKIDLEDALDYYGKYLFRIKNAQLSTKVGNSIYDDLLTISKVGGLSQQEEANTINAFSKILTEGVFLARPLRQLQMVHPQYIPYLAQAMGLKDNQIDAFVKILKDETPDETAIEKINQLMSSGQMAKAHIKSKEISIEALHAYRKDVESGLPEALKTLTSETNDLHNAWVEFKSDLVMSVKPELVELIHYLRDWAAWLKDNKESILQFGKALTTIAGGFLAYKVAAQSVNLITATYMAFMDGYAPKITLQTRLYNQQTVAINELAASIERLNFVQNAEKASFITNAAGMTMANTKGNRYIMMQEERAAMQAERNALAASAVAGASAGTSSVAEAGLLGGVSVVSGALLVTLAAGSIVMLAKAMSGEWGDTKNLGGPDFKFKNPLKGHFEEQRTGTYDLAPYQVQGQNGWIDKADTIFHTKRVFVKDTIMDAADSARLKISEELLKHFPNSNLVEDKKEVKTTASKGKGLLPSSDKVVGQRIIQYNFHINHVSGMEHVTFTSPIGSQQQVDMTAESFARVLLGVMNDAQLHDGD